MTSPFLTAEWQSLVMLNYEIDPAILQSFVPKGTELDYWEGKTFVSMVGFMFLHTRVMGLSLPFHSDFEEVNLRFYVRRLGPDGWRRGVVFIKELVPRAAIAWVARTFYNENYVALPMGHQLRMYDGGESQIAYSWILNGQRNRLEIRTEGELAPVKSGSCEEFITEHYWGYARQRDGGTMEYQVEHPRWLVQTAKEAIFDCQVEELYGKAFAPFLIRPPASAFLANGSAIVVYKGTRLNPD